MKEQQVDTYNTIDSYKEKIPFINHSFSVLLKFSKHEIKEDEFLKNLSTLAIKQSTSNQLTQEKIEQIQEKLETPGADSSYYEMMLGLIEDKKLHPRTIVFNDKQAKFENNFINDLNNYAINNGAIPNYKSKKEALKHLNIGDVCTIQNQEKISIKTDKNSIEELFINKNTYLELFSPIQKFALLQGGNGDCFLLGALYSLYNNPNSRHIILRMFKEDENGVLSAAICGYKEDKEGKITKKYKNDFEIKNIKSRFENENQKKYARQFEAMKLLEFLYRNFIEQKAQKEILEYYKQCQINCVNREMELFLDLIGEINSKEDLFRKTISLNQKVEIFTYNELVKKLETLQKQPKDKISEYLSLIIEKNIKILKENNADSIALEEIIPKTCFNELVNDIEIEPDYLNGGCSFEVFDNLNIQNEIFLLQENKIDSSLYSILDVKSFNSNFVATATTNAFDKPNKKYNLEPNHCYILFKEKNDKFAIINPHNTSKKIVVNIAELNQLFDEITIAKFS